MYEAIQTVHVLAAIIWLGGGIAVHLIFMFTPAPNRGLITPAIERFANTFLSGASGVALLAGIGMVADADHIGFTDTWILIGFAGFLISSILGGAMIGPAAKKLAAATSGEGPPDMAVVEPLSKRIMLLSRIDILVLVLVVVDMVTKPGA